jgi:hypothetical protein
VKGSLFSQEREDMSMKTDAIFKMGMFLLSLLFIATFSWAAEQKVALQAGPDGKGASGEAVIKDTAAGQKELAITVKGLKPGVYTVWFVTMTPKMDMMGVGAPDYVIKIDGKGNGSYAATVKADEPAKWQLIEIASHPTGDPKDMKKMGIALKGELSPMAKKEKGRY